MCHKSSKKGAFEKHAMCNLTNSMTYMHVFAYGGHNYSIYLHLGNLIQYLVLSVSRKKVLMYPKKIWYSLDIYFTSMDYRITTYNAGHLHMMNVNKAKSWSFYVTREKNWWEIYAWFFAYQTGLNRQHKFSFGLFVLVLRHHKYLKAFCVFYEFRKKEKISKNI